MKNIIGLLALVLLALPAHAAPSSVYMEELTWMEIRDRIQGGVKVAVVPVGGTEQNGPHMATGKHNVIVRYAAGEIARQLGDALVTPVIPVSPAGRISPPEGHMQFPGTLSVSEQTLALVLSDVAGSLKQNGFRVICFIGDHGGSQSVQKEVAEQLTDKWESSGVVVLHVSGYYNSGQDKWVESIGLKVPNPGAHAGFMDTSEMMSVHSQGVRESLRGVRAERDYKSTGASGDSTMASANHGRQLVRLKIDGAVNQIASSTRRARQ